MTTLLLSLRAHYLKMSLWSIITKHLGWRCLCQFCVGAVLFHHSISIHGIVLLGEQAVRSSILFVFWGFSVRYHLSVFTNRNSHSIILKLLCYSTFTSSNYLHTSTVDDAARCTIYFLRALHTFVRRQEVQRNRLMLIKMYRYILHLWSGMLHIHMRRMWNSQTTSF